ncbi:MAG TPA: histidine--tRNA ligase [Puia sp.]|nr:histidine--tRNA ligase [Puia sp.]
MSKPGLPQGTRDFGPQTVYKRNFIFETIRSVFELYGYEPLETPAMENLDTLLGKYGEEGDKLIFKILNNGLDHESKKDSARAAFENILAGKNDKVITERALRYDLTIPFARYVATHHHELILPFRRYQLQPVWRADRPQKGRYREFYQCDADVVGSKSLMNEVELAKIYLTVFEKLGIDAELRINHRKILEGLAASSGGVENTIPITMAIDKLDKVGIEKVKSELREKGLNDKQVQLIEKYLLIRGNNTEKIEQLTDILSNTAAQTGLQELQYVLSFFERGNLSNTRQHENIVLDFSLARGLNYYTGIIFEVRARGVNIGSIGGGGRYDDLTGLFGVPGIPGVGISFGVDRIYDVMDELKLFPPAVQQSTQVLFFNLGEEPVRRCFDLMQEFRRAGIRCELYHEQARFDKQFKYAEKKNIPRVIIIGDHELMSGNAKIKDLRSGIQSELPFGELISNLTLNA